MTGQRLEVRGSRLWARGQGSEIGGSSALLCYRLYEAVLVYVTDCMKQYSIMLQTV